MPQHNKLFLTDVTYGSMSRKDFNALKKSAIKKWHFEKVNGGGVIPVSDENKGDE